MRGLSLNLVLCLIFGLFISNANTIAQPPCPTTVATEATNQATIETTVEGNSEVTRQPQPTAQPTLTQMVLTATATPTPTPPPLIHLHIEIDSITQVEGSNSIKIVVAGRIPESRTSLRFQIDDWILIPPNQSYSETEIQNGFTDTYVINLQREDRGFFESGSYTLQTILTYRGQDVADSETFDFKAVPAPILLIDRLEYASRTNVITATVSGEFISDVAEIRFSLKVGERLWPITVQSFSESGIYQLTTDNRPPGEYVLVAELVNTVGQSLARAESETFFYNEPYIDITSVSFDPANNNFTINYTTNFISMIDFSISGDSSSQSASDIPIALQNKRLLENGQNIVTINVNDIPPWYWGKWVYVHAQATSTGDTILSLNDYEYVQYTPQLIYQVWWVTYWYISRAIIVLVILFIVRRQINWVQQVGEAPLAFIAFQRHRVVRRKVQGWSSIATLDDLAAKINRPGGAVPNILRQAQTLQSEPDNFRTLRRYTDLLTSIQQAYHRNSRLSPAQAYRNAIIKKVLSLMSQQRGALLKRYWDYDTWVKAKTIRTQPPSTHQSKLDTLLWQLSELQDATSRAQALLTAMASDFSEAVEVEVIQYFGKLMIDIRELRGRVTNNIAETAVALERIQTRLEGYAGALPPAERVIKAFDTEQVFLFSNLGNPTPLKSLMGQFVIAFGVSRQTLIAYRKEVVAYLKGVVGNISSIDALKDLKESLSRVQGDRFGDRNDALQLSLDMLNEIHGDIEAASSLAGFYKRLALQDAHFKTRGLSARVRNELPALSESLVAMAKLFEESRQQDEDADATKAYRNPYITSTPVKPDKSALFKGRINILADVINRLRDRRSGTLLLYGARRMGKSSFLYNLESLLPPQFIAVFVDCQGGTTQDDGSFFYEIARRIYLVLRNRDPESVRKIEKPTREDYVAAPSKNKDDSPRFDEHGALIVEMDDTEDEQVNYRKNAAGRLEEWLSEEVSVELRGRTLLITLDEFEEIGNAIRDGRMSINVLKQIRHMIQHNEYLVFMFAGVATLDALVHNAASYFISVNTIQLNYLEDVAAAALIRKPWGDDSTEHVPTYDDNAVKEIMRLTRNQPYLLQAMCEMIINLANEEQLDVITLDHVRRITAEIGVQYVNYFSFYWQNWGQVGEGIFRHIINGDPLPSDNLHETQEALDDMVRHRLIERRSDGSYAIEVPLMERYLKNLI